MLSRNHRARHLLRHKVLGVWIRESPALRNRQETAIQRALEVALVATDRMVHRDQVRARRERTLDLELDQGGYDGGQDMAATQHRLADGHQVGDGVVSIANELYRITSIISWGLYWAHGASHNNRVKEKVQIIPRAAH